ncbi:MAG: hypothetical protein DRG58_11395 [Deltaproteobacteria bacterium]|nr:MAG: hypothetical protein DRG58_11395 [Deltaproteobacteria bacterium]
MWKVLTKRFLAQGDKVKGKFRILIADRNPYVRQFLRRELIAEGYQATVAKDGREVLSVINSSEAPDILILDLDTPYIFELSLLELLHEDHPDLPIIIQSWPAPELNHLKMPSGVAFLENKEDIELLKKTIKEVIEKKYPLRLLAAKLGGQSSSSA